MGGGRSIEGVEPSLRAGGRVGIQRPEVVLGGCDDHSGVVEGVGLPEPVEAFGDAGALALTVGPPDVEECVEASFDVEGQAEPGVAGSGRVGHGPEAGREVFRRRCSVVDCPEPGDACPVGFFFVPPPPAFDAGLHAPDAGMKGLDPIVILDAVLGTPANLGYWEDELRAYSASVAPKPRSKRETPSVSPSDLADRVRTLGASRSRVLLRHAFGEVADTADVLERLAEAIRILDEATLDETPDEAARGDTLPTPSPSQRAPRRSATP